MQKGTHTHARVHTHTHTHMRACTHTHTLPLICTHTHTLPLICAHTHTHTHTPTHAHTYTCTHTYAHALTHTHTHTHSLSLTLQRFLDPPQLCGRWDEPWAWTLCQPQTSLDEWHQRALICEMIHHCCSATACHLHKFMRQQGTVNTW